MATAVASDKTARKVCPTCSEKYPEEDIFCGKDGARLVSPEPNVLSSGALSDQ